MKSGKKTKSGSKGGKSKARSVKSLSVKKATGIRGGQGVIGGWDFIANKKY